MKIAQDFELVRVADDYMLVPVGKKMEHFNGTVVLNEVSAFILEKLQEDRTIDELVNSIVSEFKIDAITAKNDLIIAIQKMKDLGIIYE